LRGVGIRLVSAATYYDDDRRGSAGQPAVYFGEPGFPGYVLIPRSYLVNVTSLEHERWKCEHPEFCRKFGIG